MRLIQFIQVCSSVEQGLGLKIEDALRNFCRQSSTPALVQHWSNFEFNIPRSKITEI